MPEMRMLRDRSLIMERQGRGLQNGRGGSEVFTPMKKF